MALHKTHELFNTILFIPFVFIIPEEALIPFSVGYFLGTFLRSPDIDLDFSRPTRRWKPLRFLWFPFWFFSKHRGITHIPIFGSLIKLFYLAGIIVFLYFVLLGFFSLIEFTPKAYLEFNPIKFIEDFLKSEMGFFFVLGVVVSDLFHIALDIFTTYLKRLRRKLG